LKIINLASGFNYNDNIEGQRLG